MHLPSFHLLQPSFVSSVRQTQVAVMTVTVVLPVARHDGTIGIDQGHDPATAVIIAIVTMMVMISRILFYFSYFH